MEYVSIINTCGQIHVPINLSKYCPSASTRVIILLQRFDGILLSNYMTTHVPSSHPSLVCRVSGGWEAERGSWTSPTSSRELTNVTSDLTCRGSMI